MRKFSTLFCCILLVSLLCIPLPALLRGLSTSVYTQAAERRAEAYTGHLTLWHVVSFKTGGQSGVSYLRERIRAFEQAHPYVFIDLTAYTVAEAAAALAAGDRPDLLSFPLGFCSTADGLASLPQSGRLCPPFRSVGQGADGRIYAYPYMADFYTLAVDTDRLFAMDLPLPADLILDRDTLALFAGAGPWAAGETATPASLQCLSHTLSPARSKGEPITLAAPLQPLSAFTEKKTPFLLCPAAEAGKLAMADSTMGLQTYGCSTYTDLVQCIGVWEGGSAKTEMCRLFAASLLSESAQRKLPDLKLLPTTLQPDLYAEDPLYAEQYALLCRSAVVPAAFTS